MKSKRNHWIHPNENMAQKMKPINQDDAPQPGAALVCLGQSFKSP